MGQGMLAATVKSTSQVTCNTSLNHKTTYAMRISDLEQGIVTRFKISKYLIWRQKELALQCGPLCNMNRYSKGTEYQWANYRILWLAMA